MNTSHLGWRFVPKPVLILMYMVLGSALFYGSASFVAICGGKAPTAAKTTKAAKTSKATLHVTKHKK